MPPESEVSVAPGQPVDGPGFVLAAVTQLIYGGFRKTHSTSLTVDVSPSLPSTTSIYVTLVLVLFRVLNIFGLLAKPKFVLLCEQCGAPHFAFVRVLFSGFRYWPRKY